MSMQTESHDITSTMFRISGNKVACSASREEGERFREEVNYLNYFVARLGEEIGMNAIDFAMIRESENQLAYRMNRIHGIQTGDINGLMADDGTSVQEILRELE